MYLMAAAPTIEGIAIHAERMERIKAVENRDYRETIKNEINIMFIESAAMAEGVSVDEYLNRMAEERRRDDMAKIESEYIVRKPDDKKEVDGRTIADQYRERYKEMIAEEQAQKLIERIPEK